VENRLPGGDVNPYLVLAAMIAAGLDGMERDLPPVPVFTGNAYTADLPRVPNTLADAARLFSRERFHQGGVRRRMWWRITPTWRRSNWTRSTRP
jgi:glutamine synthetase